MAIVKYDDSNANILYNDNDLRVLTDASSYGGSYHVWTTAQWCSRFNFTGTQLKIYGVGYNNRSASIDVFIDGIKMATFSQWTSDIVYNTVDAYITGLSAGEHRVSIVNNQSLVYLLDAVEVDGVLKPYNTVIITAKPQASTGGV